MEASHRFNQTKNLLKSGKVRPLRCPSPIHLGQDQIYQFTSLLFELATAPEVSTMIVKEVKLISLSRGIKLHQYLDNWLPGVPFEREALLNTKTIVNRVLGLNHQLGKARADTDVLLCGLRIFSSFSPCKTHSRQMEKTT